LAFKKIKIASIFLLCFHTAYYSKAQGGNFDRYSIAQSLAHTHVLCAFKDSKEISWSGALGGLKYFEGYTFHLFSTSNDINSFSNLPVSASFEVKSTILHGVWNNASISQTMIISPLFQKILWFRIILLSIIILFATLFIMIRLRSFKNRQKILEQLVREKTIEIIEQNKVLKNKNIELNLQKEKIMSQKNEIIEMTEKIKEADENKLNFFTNISNEFRTPLTLIMGPVEHMLENLGNKNDVRDHLKVVYRNSLRLLRLINDLLNFRKIDTHSMKILYSNGDIIRFVRDIVDAFKDFSKEKKINLRFTSSIDSYTTWFDPSKLEIIFYNLISNAIKFNNINGLVNVSVLLDEGGETIEFVIEDNGIGIEEGTLNHIFEKFYHIESSNYIHKAGFGIGLLLTKEMIDLLKGDIKVKSSKEKGTRFKIILPILSEADLGESKNIIIYSENEPQFSPPLISQYINEPEADDISVASKSSKQEKHVQKILVIEDNFDMRNYIKTCLSDNYNVFEADNGVSGINKTKEIQPNLIITDIMMPEMDGIEFCRIIKEDFVTSHIPVILLSALTTFEMQIEGLETGADAFIVKPFNKKYLLTCIRSIITSREKLRKTFQVRINIEPKEITTTSLDEVFLQNAKEIVEENIDNPDFGLNELIKSLGMSRTLVHMKFTELINCSTGEFIRQIRLKRACQLLKQSTFRVSDICYMVGFSDPHHFSKVFKKYYGFTPSEYIDNKFMKE
jgi:signal transduction histidine kinase/AraC-like DNA-binding protein